MRNLGFLGVSESAREVLSSQIAIDGPALPAKDPLLFIQSMLSLTLEEYEKAKSTKGPVYWDRGLPDLIAYAIRFGVDPTEFEEVARRFSFNKAVFIFPPWKKIFVNDNERRLSFDMSLQFHELVADTYSRLNFNLIEVPLVSPETRAQFIADRSKKL